ncbi:amidase signature enzyme [Wolfiporia cocos MD-104 SS10]|uniref:amidase n=1 Tax=Wolfiporia cocos (strain MD-104) TaxID=742152 RepID=A0A2H3K4J5_WOLCO|nr:amidase signature enzyme [Wolfiporia cocos MD-104 SS10]
MFSYLAHRRACTAKQQERRERIQKLSPAFHAPLSASDKDILAKPISDIVRDVQSGTLSPSDVLLAYGKKALKAHEATNCLTEVMISQAEEWAKTCNVNGPLAGMPVSLKDENSVAGFDACLGYSALVGQPMQKDSALVRLLRDAGAVPFVKTNVPVTMMSFECANDVFGTTTNPHGKGYAPGGSSGGEAALLAYGGSRIGVGSDIAGSVRVPSHYSGSYTIKASSSRFPHAGNPNTSIPGVKGVPASFSPMTRTLEDLETFWRAVMSMRPWEYDHSVIPTPWREVSLPTERPIRWGVMWDDGVVTPSPACKRALTEVVTTLKSRGHDVVPIDPPSPFEGLKLAGQLVFADGAKCCVDPIHFGEFNDPGVREAVGMFRAPRFFKRLYAWYLRYIRRDELYAQLVESWYEKTMPEYLMLVSKREAYRERWFEYLKEQRLDFIITVPNALPAVPHGGMLEGWKSCGYTFLWNLLDYTAGIIPVTHVDQHRDELGAFNPRNAVEAGAYRSYNAQKMHGLPVGIEIIGKRLEEEKVLEGMKLIHGLLRQDGRAYGLFEAD